MKRNFVMLLTTAGAMLLSQSAVAEVNKKGPSKEETISFINQTLQSESGGRNYNEDHKGRRRYTESSQGSVEACAVTLDSEMGMLDGGEWWEKTRHKFDLKNIEKVGMPELSPWRFYAIYFRATNNQKLINRESFDSFGDKKAEAGNVAYLYSSNEKLAKAFNHLRKLCGGPEPLEF